MLARLSAAILLLYSSGAAATTTLTFEHTGQIVTWVAPLTTEYRVTAIGAAGASADFFWLPGRGASIAGNFNFTAGQSFFLAVGGQGAKSARDGGGGGGSFFVGSDNRPLLIAGGGGGLRTSGATNGQDASITTRARASSGNNDRRVDGESGVVPGQGGRVFDTSWGAAGAGFFSNGAADPRGSSPINSGGKSWANGLAGGTGIRGADGGFGGGGSGEGSNGGGGGGGYTGGDGGWVAGGGGSFNSGLNRIAIAGVGTGNGLITISFEGPISAIPEPTSWAMLIVGFGLAGAVMRQRRNQAA